MMIDVEVMRDPLSDFVEKWIYVSLTVVRSRDALML